MPEGPSIVLLKEQVQSFTGKKIISATTDSKIDLSRLAGQKIIVFKTWGKHFLICFKEFTIRIHLLMFGTYLINERKQRVARLGLSFKDGELNFYTCAVKLLEGPLENHYDFSADIMSDEWDVKKAISKLKKHPDLLVCDALLEQDIFSGVGNIIKNEVLYRIKVHPESSIKNIPSPKIKKMAEQARIYSYEFLQWKRDNELKKHWLAHTKTICLRCNLPILKKYTGVKKRRSFFCKNCQTLYI